MEDQAREPSRLPGAQVGGGNTRHASPDPLVPEGPSRLALFFSPPPPSYAPRTNKAWKEPWTAEDLAGEPCKLPGASWAGETLGVLPMIL